LRVLLYILDQLEALAQLPHPVTDAVGWIALKLGLTRQQAARKIARAQQPREASQRPASTP